MDRALDRLRERRDHQELLELESLLSDPLSSEGEGLALRVRVEDLRQRISERQRQPQARNDWAQGGMN
jgi:hypothetical protein